MCWVNIKLNKRIANKDITVYKIVIPKENGCTSLYKEFDYDFHKTYTELIHIDYAHDVYYINEGFHSYKSLEVAQYILAFIRINRRECNGRIIRCIIPKGAIYYINNYKEVVSNKIIIDSCYE